MDTLVSTTIQERVREIVFLLMQRPITEEIALQVDSCEGFEDLDIVNGAWVGFDKDEYMTGEEHGRIEYKLILRIGNHVEQNDLGMLYPGDTDFVLDGVPGDIRIRRRPDVAFVRKGRLKKTQGYYFGVPDLAVEIISPTEKPDAIQEKLSQYLQYGVEQVWQVYPGARQVVVHRPDGTSRTYSVNDMISGSDLLPGLELPVVGLFDID